MPRLHLSLDRVVSTALSAASRNRVLLAKYDNPDTPDDEKARIIQPIRFVQAKSNLLCLCWQYAPLSDYRTFRMHYFIELQPLPYCGLFLSTSLSLENTIDWHEIDVHTRREYPYDRRGSRVQAMEIWWFDVLRKISLSPSGQSVEMLPEQPPLPQKLAAAIKAGAM